jgi:hypothetical protein
VVVSAAALVAYTNGYIFQNDEPVSVFEDFLFYYPLLYDAIAVFALVSVHFTNPNDAGSTSSNNSPTFNAEDRLMKVKGEPLSKQNTVFTASFPEG